MGGVNDFERVENTMIANSEDRLTLAQTMGRLTTAVGLAATAGIILSAAAAPVRLVGVTRQGDTVLIEATEPVAYSVSRPDALSLVVDMRNVTVADARADVERQGAIAGVRLEQTSAVDGRALARVHVALAKPTEYIVRSARNTIRVELKGSAAGASAPPVAPERSAAAPARPQPATSSMAALAPAAVAQPQASAPLMSPETSVETGSQTATFIERIKSSKTSAATTVTLVGNGRLAPVGVTESKDRPRRLVIDFPNVTSKAPAQTAIDSPFVTRVRIGVNSHEPLVTRVVMEIASSASYRMERSGDSGRDLAVVFEQARPVNTVTLPLADPVQGPTEPEPPITLEQAIANAAAITKPEPAGALIDPMLALKTAAATPGPAVQPERTTPAARVSAAPSSRGVAPTSPAVAPRTQTVQASAVPQLQPAQPAQPATAPAQTRQVPALASGQGAAANPQPPVPPATAQGAARSGEQPRQFTGEPMSLDLDGVDLRAVLRTFADVSGLNMVIDPDVQGTVDIILKDVPWDQALDVVLRGNQLDYTVDGTIVRVSRIATLEAENKARQSAAQAAAERQAQAGGLSFETFPLSYAKAEDMVPLLKNSLRLSKYGQVQYDRRTNTLIIADLPEQFPAIRQLLSSLDRAEPQVEIEARIITTTREFARAIGVQWGLNGRMTPEIGNTTNLAFPNQGAVDGRLGTPDGPVTQGPGNTSTVVNLPVPTANSAIGLALGAVNGAFNLDVALSALERSGKGRILSTPRVTTQNNIEAEIMQGVQIPLVTPPTANTPETVTYKDAALTLRVTPQITAANTVIMQIMVENASPGEVRGNNVQIDTQRANTRVQVSDGATTVMGGVFISREVSSVDRTPVLYRLPLLGWLFKRDTQADDSRELLIFITPRILKG
jgi:type IV pilus assembly protein PilQ